MKIRAIKCPKCEDIIYSRTRHDYRTCICGDVSVDGGFDYCKISWSSKAPENIEIEVDTTKELLYDDYRQDKNKFGRIPKEAQDVGEQSIYNSKRVSKRSKKSS